VEFFGGQFTPLVPISVGVPLMGDWLVVEPPPEKIGSSRENLQETVVFFLRASLGILKYVDNNLILWKI
jgi:hypothetical protein